MMAFETLFFLALLTPHLRQRRVQAEHLDPGWRALCARRSTPRPRLLDLLRGHQPRRVPGAAGLRNAGRGVGWHYGFGAAGIGMLIGLTTYLYAGVRCRPMSGPGRNRSPEPESRSTEPSGARGCSSDPLPALSLFWATYEQQGNTIALWAEDHTDRSVNLILWSGEIPTTWFQAVNPLLIFAFTPLIVGLWARQARRHQRALDGDEDDARLLGRRGCPT